MLGNLQKTAMVKSILRRSPVNFNIISKQYKLSLNYVINNKLPKLPVNDHIFFQLLKLPLSYEITGKSKSNGKLRKFSVNYQNYQ